MIISNHYIPNELILRYCKIISMLEKEYSSHLEWARSEIHEEIFNYAKCMRAGITRDDREFIKCLNKTILDLTATDRNLPHIFLNKPIRNLNAGD